MIEQLVMRGNYCVSFAVLLYPQNMFFTKVNLDPVGQILVACDLRPLKPHGFPLFAPFPFHFLFN